MRIHDHPVLGPTEPAAPARIWLGDRPIAAREGEPIAAALAAAGVRVCRPSRKSGEPRGVFCALGRCTDCVMTVDGVPNVRTCVTPARDGMRLSAPAVPAPRRGRHRPGRAGLPATRAAVGGVSELRRLPGYPSAARLRRGPVAVLECGEAIPCDPCAAACPSGAITVGESITNLPMLDAERCQGCGLCVAACPGMAIFVLERAGADGLVSLPYEMLPLPRLGDAVTALDRQGKPLGAAEVVRVRRPPLFGRCAVVTIRVPARQLHQARAIRTMR